MVKWTPDKDQLLLLKILETHEIVVDAKKISEAWSQDDDAPTARAITERIVKIRQNARANGGQHFGISSSQAKKPRGKPSTPYKPRTPQTPKTNGKTATHSTTGNGLDRDDSPILAAKRKREDANGSTAIESIDLTGDDESHNAGSANGQATSFRSTTALSNGVNGNTRPNGHATVGAPSERMRQLSVKVEDEEAGDEAESPSKRQRQTFNDYTPYESEGEDDDAVAI